MRKRSFMASMLALDSIDPARRLDRTPSSSCRSWSECLVCVYRVAEGRLRATDRVDAISECGDAHLGPACRHGRASRVGVGGQVVDEYGGRTDSGAGPAADGVHRHLIRP